MPQNDDGSITLEYLRMNKYIYISSIWAPCLQTLTCAFMLLKGKNAPQAHFTGIGALLSNVLNRNPFRRIIAKLYAAPRERGSDGPNGIASRR